MKVDFDMENCILIDWFSITCRNDTVSSIISKLHLREGIEFTETYGFYGYRNRLVFDGISIHYGHKFEDQDFPMLEMTGQGCRDFETYSEIDWQYLFEMALDTENYNITRLDVAYDDFAYDDSCGIFNIKQIIKDTQQRNFIAKSRTGIITNSFKGGSDAYSVMFGSRTSDLYIRIYDKARERGFHDGRHWIRLETVFKQDRALAFLRDVNPLGIKYRGVVHNYLRFVTPDKSDDNKSRWSTRKYWQRFLDDVDKISIYTKKDVDYNLTRLGHYVFTQAGNSIDTYIRCQGLISFLDKLLKRDSRLTPHQKQLISEFRNQMKDKDVISEETIYGISDYLKSKCDNEAPAPD